MWFKDLTGFSEESPQQVRENLTVTDGKLVSAVNKKEYTCGTLETPSLAELRARVAELDPGSEGQCSLRECIGDVQSLHIENPGAVFQVASQFNLLEMVSPDVSPDGGVGRYEFDLTQGPACAIAAGAGTIFRNYFAEVNGKTGQSSDNQIDTLQDIGVGLGNESNCLWEMRNGYALASASGLKTISDRLGAASETELDDLRGRLRVGVQWGTEVTLSPAKNLVTQVYCSALPVAYSRHSAVQWQPFASLILEASYEAVICAAILNKAKTGNNQLFLTQIGGGAFGNSTGWIMRAIDRALLLYKNTADLDIQIVSYRYASSEVEKLVEKFNR